MFWGLTTMTGYQPNYQKKKDEEKEKSLCVGRKKRRKLLFDPHSWLSIFILALIMHLANQN